MLQYPSILGVKKMPIGLPCVAFYKYDGSNLRFEWNHKRGWHKFGSRTQIIDKTHEVFGGAIELFQDTMGQSIVERVRSYDPKQFRSLERLTAFAEFYGDNSFAGYHEESDEKRLTLFDIFLFKKGFMPPKDFVDIFSGETWSPQVVYQGNLNAAFIEQVRRNALTNYPLFEGVICKGMNPQAKKGKELWMTKIKTIDYLDKLKNHYGDKWENYAE